jgi:hypothetical protein
MPVAVVEDLKVKVVQVVRVAAVLVDQAMALVEVLLL